MFSVTGFQNALLSSDTISSACSSVTLVRSTGIRRAGKSGSYTIVNPASFPIVSNTILASFDMCRLMGARDSGLISGGSEASRGGAGPAAASAAVSSA